MPKKAKRHDQRGVSLGICPKCLKDMWKGEGTVVTPVRLDGKLVAVLSHTYCKEVM